MFIVLWYKLIFASVGIPNSVKIIWWDAFYGCTNLKSVVFKSSTPPDCYDAFIDCDKLTTMSPKARSPLQKVGVLKGYKIVTFDEYKITYKLNGGKNPSGTDKTYTTAVSTKLSTPTRSGYALSGWYTKSNFSSSSKVTSISKTRAGNITLYAKWVKLPTKPKSVSATANSKSKITVTWKKVSGAEGYEVYRATSKDGKYKKAKTVSKGATVKYADKSLKSNNKVLLQSKGVQDGER